MTENGGKDQGASGQGKRKKFNIPRLAGKKIKLTPPAPLRTATTSNISCVIFEDEVMNDTLARPMRGDEKALSALKNIMKIRTIPGVEAFITEGTTDNDLTEENRLMIYAHASALLFFVCKNMNQKNESAAVSRFAQVVRASGLASPMIESDFDFSPYYDIYQKPYAMTIRRAVFSWEPENDYEVAMKSQALLLMGWYGMFMIEHLLLFIQQPPTQIYLRKAFLLEVAKLLGHWRGWEKVYHNEYKGVPGIEGNPQYMFSVGDEDPSLHTKNYPNICEVLRVYYQDYLQTKDYKNYQFASGVATIPPSVILSDLRTPLDSSIHLDEDMLGILRSLNINTDSAQKAADKLNGK